ncbi:DUF3987 domain-containing protein [Halomonas coralii]|uniref:YfjI family protein n=1 Tax=Modicisalibacter sp. R2A 31.J TaxID=2831898 RepID=UPI001CCD4FFA|nr:YfjI family protein [Modicisalibacter sp. R2A 31.J]MBZ9557330.1 DUF3987 domain-containing protein [Modicisalibacter sp. R2A 31.J]
MDDISDTIHEVQDSSSLSEAQYEIPAIENEWPHFREGSRFESAVVAVSDHVQVAYEMAVSVALGAMATACQGLVDVEYSNGHRVPTSLMMLVAARSGERKTALEGWFFGPIRELQREKEADFKCLQRVYAREAKTWEEKEKVLRKMVIKAFQEGQTTEALEERLAEHDKTKPIPPTDYRLIYENTTPSALTYGLHTNIPIACLLSSEAGSLFSGKAFEDLYLFNALWSGSSISDARRTSESFILDDARLTSALMIQPDIIQRFLDKRGDDAHGSGFLARFLIAYPTPMVGHRDEIPAEISDADIAPFQERLRELLLESLDTLDNQRPRRVLTFTASAKKLWKKLYRRIEQEILPDQLYYHAEGHASKLMDNISRIAGVLHTFEGDSGGIDTDTLKYAYRLGRHYSRHYLDHIAGEPEIVTLGNRLVQDIRKFAVYNNDQYRFVISDIKQRTHPKLRKKDKMKAAITLLKRLGHLQEQSHGKQLVFKDTVLGSREPELKNGEVYYLEELPRFEEQELIPGRGVIQPRYELESPLNNDWG